MFNQFCYGIANIEDQSKTDEELHLVATLLGKPSKCNAIHYYISAIKFYTFMM